MQAISMCTTIAAGSRIGLLQDIPWREIVAKKNMKTLARGATRSTPSKARFNGLAATLISHSSNK